MDRIREARRTTMAANGLTRRRHRTNTLRDSPDEDGAIELQEPTRLRDRGSGKKDRDRERERERDRLGRTKRRRGDRLMHSSREDGGDDTSEDSINDEEDDDDGDGGLGGRDGGASAPGSAGASVRMLPLNPSSMSSSSSSLNHHRKSFPPAKVFRPTPPTTWKAADEMIGVSIPRKARSASTKRSHECWASTSAITAEQNHRQASTSPVRTAMAATAAPASPSSSNASARKKIKPNGGGPKFRPPKSSSKSSSSAQDDIEIEIAEVLYGMGRQSQGPSRHEILAHEPSREANKSSGDGKSRISSPISNSQSSLPQNSSSSAVTVSAVAPKRKKPRPVKPEDENPTIFGARSSPISPAMKPESEQPSKNETCSLNSDKNDTGSAPENLDNQQPVGPSPELIKPEGNVLSDSKPLVEESGKPKDVGLSSKEVMAAPHSPKKESAAVQQVDDDREDVKATKANPTISEGENQREEKFQIDLMAPPPPLRSSPERDVVMNMVVDAEKEVKPAMKQDEKQVRMNKDEAAVGLEKEKMRAMVEEAESNKAVNFLKERGIDLHLDLEKTDKGDTGANGTLASKKQHQTVQRQQPQQTNSDKNVQSNSLPLPMSVPSWPGGLPPMSYMTPLQGVVSMDGTTVTPAAIPPPHLLFNQPRPKRCATHCYIARTIMYHQQIARMNPFWPAAAGSASLYGTKPGHLNMVPSTDLHGNLPGRATNSTQDKGHSLAMFPAHIGKDKATPPAAVDNQSRKQILLQQALPPGAAPSNILHGPAFIFPLNQQQAAAAASVRPGSVKSLPVTSNGASSGPSNSAPPNATATGAAAAPTMSFSYPNMPGNETQYLAILQNNAYPFPIPAHVGSPPAYRGTHAQAFPFFNGSFYSSQMLHPSQIQQQQQLPVQSQQNQQHGHQNTSISSGSSSSQKHAQNQQQKPNAATGPNGGVTGGGGGGGSLQGFPVTKNLSSQPLQMQQQHPRQQLPNHHASHPARQIESEMGGEDSPSAADSRIPRTTMNIYGQSFAMPMQTPNFALMSPASISGVGSNGSEKKQPQQQHPGSKAGGEASQAFAVSFAPINGATAAPGLDLSSIAQNHSIMQHHNYQLMAAAQAASAQNKKNYHVPEEGKSAGNSSNLDEDRKTMSSKIQSSMGQSIAFSRPDVSDPSITSIAGSNVIDSSGRSLNLGSASSRASASVMPAAINSPSAASQSQQMQRCQQQILQLQKQSQFAAAAAASTRNKTPSTSNGIVYSDNLPSTSAMATKYPNAVSAFPQNLVQSSSTVAQSAQWKNSTRPTTSQSPPSMASTTPSSVKSLPLQQQGRSQQAHAQISFAASPKPSTAQVQPSSSTQSPSPPVVVGSPTTSSVSKNTGSPRTTSASNNNKISQTSSLSSQQAKNSSAVPARKSSPVGGRNVPSILSGPQLPPSSTSSGSKSQLPQQQQKQQQQLPKQTMPQAQLFFSNPYMHSQVSQSGSSPSATSAAASGYYIQRRGPEQMQRPGSSGNSSNGAAVNNSKGSTIPGQGLMHPAQFAAMPPSGNHHQFVPNFPYVHPVPTAVQVKPSDQKQPAGE
ncbi:protein TIME FOR COFFEE isoform X1 [Arachis stenosperma]|uniref:protein TIME FOR COFFEE isoform X1 n=1 Tax=Arachis stenosperma TaxID=217475 RepID=UPI0025AD17EC|nr:protein TIME FOR COFFEE isoform X1 [Arachis stenosperma]